MDKYIVFIFDWDDTLFPTTWFTMSGLKATGLKTPDSRMINISQQTHFIYFKELDIYIYRLLKLASDVGVVLIVTNATHEWVTSTSALLPITSKLISEKIRIISARDMYQTKYDMPLWKTKTFHNEISNYVKRATQVITIGDSEFEHRALASLKNTISPKKLKAIRFVRSPEFDVLVDQLGTLTKSISNICKISGPLDLSFAVPTMRVSGFIDNNSLTHSSSLSDYPFASNNINWITRN